MAHDLWFMAHGESLSFDRRADQVAPFRPAAVVVPDFVEAEQILQRKPGMAAALADAAISNRVAVRRQLVVFTVELLELRRRLERAVIRIDCLCPRDALCSRNVAAAERALVRVI